MPPKKKPPQKRSSKPKPQSQPSSSSGPKLQISAENENRLRRLLLNSGQSSQPFSVAPLVEDNLSKAQKAKKLTAIYENLSCEGFLDSQIELALSSLKDNATFEAALDWLCLNLPGNELPLKFSSGNSLQEGEYEGSVGVISTAREGYVPPNDSPRTIQVDLQEVAFKIKERKSVETLDSCKQSQADWIRQYMEQQEEDEDRTWEDDADPEPRSYDVITKDYYAARVEAAKAKERGDKKGQEQAGLIIRKLKQELSALGLSVDFLSQEFAHQYQSDSLSMPEGSYTPAVEQLQATPVDSEDSFLPIWSAEESSACEDNIVCSSHTEASSKPLSSNALDTKKDDLGNESEEVDIGDFFLEDSTSKELMAAEVLELQKNEKMKELCSGKNVEKLDGIWKKGDPRKIPKAVLHQLCQKSGWEAPKFDKVHEKREGFSYSVSVLRKASGRGKNRKAGGLMTIRLPNPDETFESVEDAQNTVAAFALNQLFPDIPVHLAIAEPYDSLVLKWKGGMSSEVEARVDDRRAGFVDQLLSSNGSSSNAFVTTNRVTETLNAGGKTDSLSDSVTNLVARRVNHSKDGESNRLKREHDKKKSMQKYKEISKARGTLPIAGLKSEILQVLKENDVVVVCGETGSGKTTQVPQFVLDDMVESGCGGHCNIICTQPRRIAAISVADRVAYERCESSPGADGSLVGYQVRLDSARNDGTKLLFCTTGILLRKLLADQNLTGISHVVVDEVHERSLLGDFLLIVLKNLMEKQTTYGLPKVKVILMSATVDSNLFSSYFGHCPVLTAQGRTHPVTTYFLEDVYESVDYRLASDSPAALRHHTSGSHKSGLVDNHRGKKNLVLSGWGDDSVLLEDIINPHFSSGSYDSYSEQTRQNLRRLNEDVIDYDLLEDLVCHVDETFDEGAILVFLPGVSEIYTLHDRLASLSRFSGPSSDWILPLHSSVASTEQKKVFMSPPENIRKIIIATNIAETSITIDDVVYVIDSGKHKENRYNPKKKLSSMVEDWISQANARQRRGRAGRVKPGVCLCLYTRHRFEKLMRPYQVPEMLRMPLVELCLQIKLLSLGHIKPFLEKALEPPTEEAVTSAISLLYEVGALEGNEELTPLGHHLAKLPVDVLVGKIMLYGAIFGCLSPILSISAFLSYKSPFVYPKDEKQAAERAKLALLNYKVDSTVDSVGNDGQSDHLVMMVAYRKWAKIMREKGVRAAEQFCKPFFLSSSVMYMIRDMRVQFGTLLADIGLIDPPRNRQSSAKRKEDLDRWLSDTSQPFNMYSHHSSIVKAILCAGLYPNVVATEQGLSAAALNNLKPSQSSASKGFSTWYDGRREVHIHPSSVNSSSKTLQYPFAVFLDKVETNRVFIRDTTIISPFSLLLFGGSINIQHQSGLVTIDGWLKLAAPAQTAVLFKELRLTLHSLLRELIQKPEKSRIVDNVVVKSMVHLLVEEDKPT
ncbi:DExH-box ATP-dependent RNA helicase DExH7, chloroplastic [Linum perenne]